MGEEAVETALAAVSQDKPETLSEAADLVYHLTVLLHHQGLTWADVLQNCKNAIRELACIRRVQINSRHK